MEMTFFDFYYDPIGEVPVAVLKNNVGKTFYFKISHRTADNIHSFQKNDNSINMYNIIYDFLNYATEKRLSIEKYENNVYFGYLFSKIGDKIYNYYLNSDDLIYLSIILKTSIDVDTLVFYDFLEKSNTVAVKKDSKLLGMII